MRRLLALDLDGTLLRRDQTIAPEDARAIKHAIAQGVVVTIATGRVASGSLHIAREVGIDAPIVCADGGAVVCARTGEVQERTPLGSALARGTVRAFDLGGLAPFVMLLDEIHTDERGRPHLEMVRVWTQHVVVHPHIGHGDGVWGAENTAAFGVGVGPAEGVTLAEEHIAQAHGDAIERVSFDMRSGGLRALLARPAGCSKGAALSRLAARLGVDQKHTAVVGDWFNDVPMFQWAARSFAMGQAHDAVKACATDVLDATCVKGGGVAEAIERWMATPQEETASEMSDEAAKGVVR